jgi:hypothetical protein
MELDTTTSPASFSFDIGGRVHYDYQIVKADESIIINADTDIRLGTAGFEVDLVPFTLPAPTAEGYYSSYTLDLDGYPGFYRFGGLLEFRTYTSLTPTWTRINLSPFGEIGVGRLHSSIRIIRQVLLIMDKLGIEPTEERVRSSAEIIATRSTRLNAYTENYTDNYREYYNDLAEALGYTGNILNLVYIENSQEYSFEIGRSSFMNYGWEASVKLSPSFNYNSWNAAGNEASFGIDLVLGAQYADFAMDGMLYYYGAASMTPGYASAFTFVANMYGEAAYLPENPRWYARGRATIAFNKDSTPKLACTLDATVNYLITPNFTTFAGLDFGTNFDVIAVTAGGTYRIW